MLSFKQILESPDKLVYVQNDLSLHWSDKNTCTFFVTRNLWMYVKGEPTQHNLIIHLLKHLVHNNPSFVQKKFDHYKFSASTDSVSQREVVIHGSISKLVNSLKLNGFEPRTEIIDNYRKKYNESIIVGRIWLNNNMASLWNNASELSEEELNSLMNFFQKDLGVDLSKLMIEVSGKIYDSKEIKHVTTDDFKETWHSSETHKFDPTQAHTLPPEKKKEYLRNIGAKPKKPLGIQQRYAMGESVIKESPDEVFYTWIEGFGFMVSPDFVAYQKKDATKNTYTNHYMIGQKIKSLLSKKSDPSKVNYSDSEVIIKGDFSNYDRKYFNDPRKLHSMKYFSEKDTLIGRYWTDDNIVSFWNDAHYFTPENISVIRKFLESAYDAPEDLYYNIFISKNIREQLNKIGMELAIDPDGYSTITYDELLTIMEMNASPDNTPRSDLDKIHLLSPEKKGEVLKQKGVLPKKPINLKLKFALGEKYIKESPDTIRVGNQQIPFTEGLTFIFSKKFQAWTKYANYEQTHINFFKQIEKLFLQAKLKGQEDTLKNVQLTLNIDEEYAEEDCSFFVEGDIRNVYNDLAKGSRAQIIGRTGDDTVILGRYFPNFQMVSLWNPPEYLNESIMKDLRTFLKQKLNVHDTADYEVPILPPNQDFDMENDFLEDLNYKPFKFPALIDLIKKRSSSNMILKSTDLHTLDPSVKGDVMKQQGIVPKKPLGANLRFALGESKSNIQK